MLENTSWFYYLRGISLFLPSFSAAGIPRMTEGSVAAAAAVQLPTSLGISNQPNFSVLGAFTWQLALGGRTYGIIDLGERLRGV